MRLMNRTARLGITALLAASSIGVLTPTIAAAERSVPLTSDVLLEIDLHQPGAIPLIDPVDVVVYADGRLVVGNQDYFGTTSQTPGYSVRYLTPTGMGEVRERLGKISGGETKSTSLPMTTGCARDAATIVTRWTLPGSTATGELSVYGPKACQRDAATVARLDALQALFDWLRSGATGFSSEPQLYGSRRIMMATYTTYDQRYYQSHQTKDWPRDLAQPLLDPTAAPSINAWGGRCEIRTSWPGLLIWILSVFTRTDTGYVTGLGVTHPFVRPLLEHEVGCIQESVS